MIWEEGADLEGSGELLQKLGRFRPAVLGLLERDPQQRLGVTAFIDSFRAVLHS